MSVQGIMSNYLVHYTKKKQILKRKEQALLRLLDDSTTTDQKLFEAVLEIKEAKIRVLRSKKSQVVPTGHNESKLAKIEAEISKVEQMTLEEILSQYT